MRKLRCIACGSKLDGRRSVVHAADCGYLCYTCSVAYDMGVVHATRKMREEEKKEMSVADVNESLKEIKDNYNRIIDKLTVMEYRKRCRCRNTDVSDTD